MPAGFHQRKASLRSDAAEQLLARADSTGAGAPLLSTRADSTDSTTPPLLRGPLYVRHRMPPELSTNVGRIYDRLLQVTVWRMLRWLLLLTSSSLLLAYFLYTHAAQ